ncbi:universal stress protein [Gelidibacter maritimus]|uniref:Universal stress protein n=1 Tax=Gelidibacter maritimus TaxID=2761487 RepID=A0A7W2M8F2_9FLAO|nr:universal stress protein [Gelidibacter maritimus]MBA6154594.1 universal stress protein [Gelidibacter maritimus]
MNKRFIVLIDFSEYSSNLIKYACDWSQEINAKILLHHQTHAFLPAFAENDAREYLIRQANDKALEKLTKLANDLIPETIEVAYYVSEIDFHQTLPKLLEEPFENLVFIGLKGTGMLKKLFLGSVALRIIGNTENTVVAMPKGINSFSHEKIFVAVGEKKPLNIQQLDNFLEFIDHKNTSITFFHLAKPNEDTNLIKEQLQKLSDTYADKFTTNFAIYEANNRVYGIKAVINNKIDEILIVQKGSRILTDQLFSRFLINELVYEGQTPLIILP